MIFEASRGVRLWLACGVASSSDGGHQEGFKMRG